MLGCNRNAGPLNFIIAGPSIDKFEKITLLISKISKFKRIQGTEMKIKSLEGKHFSIAYQGSMARWDTGKFLGWPLSSEFILPRKISNLNKIFGEKAPHLHLYSSSQFRIRGGQHLQRGNSERDAWNMNRASERGTRRGKLSQSLEV